MATSWPSSNQLRYNVCGQIFSTFKVVTVRPHRTPQIDMRASSYGLTPVVFVDTYNVKIVRAWVFVGCPSPPRMHKRMRPHHDKSAKAGLSV